MLYNKKEKDYGLTFWIHLIITIPAYLSWMLFSWTYVIIGVIIIKISYKIFGGCIFTIKEFGKETEEMTFIGHYLEKWGIIKKNTKKTKWIIRTVNPILITLLSLIYQLIFKINPLIF